MDKEQLYQIAKIIDSEYFGKEKTFTAIRKVGYWYLSTNVCDWASFIKVFESDGKIYLVQRLGDDTEGWQNITDTTWQKIKNKLCLN